MTIIAACLILLKPLFVRLFPDHVERHVRRQHAAGDNIHHGLITLPEEHTHILDGTSIHGHAATSRCPPASGAQHNAADWTSDLEGLELPRRNVHIKEPKASISYLRLIFAKSRTKVRKESKIYHRRMSPLPSTLLKL